MGARRSLTLLAFAASVIVSCAPGFFGPLNDGADTIKVEINLKDGQPAELLIKDGAINNGITFINGRIIRCPNGTERDLGSNARLVGILPPAVRVVGPVDASLFCSLDQQGTDEYIERGGPEQ
ncbi:MAG TPA: hypothetical protein VJC17_02740 [Candidatus Dojkabacteria bacterium]|nr:hypothetical protein [Candidatus Dojkabacteria bacterium]